MMEFHISREARERYQVDASLFSYTGNVVFADMAASRQLAHRINQVRGTENDPAQAVNPAALFAMGLIDEASHILLARYRESVDANVITDAMVHLEGVLGKESVQASLQKFVEEFPGSSVYQGRETATAWLQGSTGTMSHRAAAFEEMILLWMANGNPAFQPFHELFDDTRLAQGTPYRKLTAELPVFFAGKPAFGEPGKTLLDLLLAPVKASPDSLSGQLSFIREHWGFALGDSIRRLLLAADVLKEEELAIWMRFHPPSDATIEARRHAQGFSAGRGEVATFSDSAQEYERFSPDLDWMPNTVMIAKSTYVWLAQLAKAHKREIKRLDQIPDEELATLAERGINALWLIGIWERSRASKTIKQLTGNHDAVASAYSLMNYAISADLGGEDAYRNLRDRAMAKGIRLASDMVPNHMGIDSNWVIDHPEWFLSRRDSPYPAYRFEGPDLSSDGRVEIKIEDHYFEQTDAAVVFRRRDKWTGDTLYIYHGNDGTSFPWNDTAQLNYLSGVVREQVIQTILHVARLFPIIRFDAAMTLAKRHVQRLWFPVPGSGGAIPSRAECAMTREEFEAAMPHEFWREVVDRVAAEVPGTLLLAEAFWLMEGFFVRTLGMHRVYNSAFMVMLRDEDNANYRSVLKNTLEFDPDIMKRYVNFMSNPDERTAIDQFGDGDKYFGVATMMATLPGLPMIGHGQVEAFTEKYGMEYQRPRYDETPRQPLVERHLREIAPLLHSRYLFAESENFLLYDFWKDDGSVDENVFAYSNRRGDQRAVILYNNRYGSTHGTIHRSVAYADKGAGTLRQRSLEEGLGLPNDYNLILAYRDTASGLEYLKRSSDLVSKGLTVELHAYRYAVLMHWRELRDSAEHPWGKLCDRLNGAGVASVDDALAMMHLQPLHDRLRALLDASLVGEVAKVGEQVEPTAPVKKTEPREQKSAKDLEQSLQARFAALLSEAQHSREWKEIACSKSAAAPTTGKQAIVSEAASSVLPATAVSSSPKPVAPVFLEQVGAMLKVPRLEGCFTSVWPAHVRSVFPSLNPPAKSLSIWGPALAWAILRSLGQMADAQPFAAAIALFDRLRLRQPLAESFAALGLAGEESWRAASRVRVALLAAQDAGTARQAVLPEALWEDLDWRWLMGVHDADEHTYFNKEGFEQGLWWLQWPSVVRLAGETGSQTGCRALEESVAALAEKAKASGYDLDRFLGRARPTPEKTAAPNETASTDQASASEDPTGGQSAASPSTEPRKPEAPSGNPEETAPTPAKR